MSWDYSFFNQPTLSATNSSNNINSINNGLVKNNYTDLPLNSQLPQSIPANTGSVSSISSTESVTNNMGTFDNASESEIEAKLLPSNFWNQNNSAINNKLPNTLEESRFLQNQLSGTVGDSWYPTGNQPQQPSSNDSFLSRYATPTSSTPTTNSSFSASASVQSNFNPLSFNMPSPAQLPQFQNTNNSINANPANANNNQGVSQIINSTQSLLQSYQQQQVYLENLQSQQQQLLQNPLFLQQQAQLVSQQLQQLQLQLQLQQQQIESTAQLLSAQTKNTENISNANNLPSLTEENLTKLSSDATKNVTTVPIESNAGSSNGSNEKNINTELYKTELCSTFQKNGACPYGSKCQFAHGAHELKVIDRGNKWRSKPCANWSKTGSCRYGNRCCFRHGE